MLLYAFLNKLFFFFSEKSSTGFTGPKLSIAHKIGKQTNKMYLTGETWAGSRLGLPFSLLFFWSSKAETRLREGGSNSLLSCESKSCSRACSEPPEVPRLARKEPVDEFLQLPLVRPSALKSQLHLVSFHSSLHCGTTGFSQFLTHFGKGQLKSASFLTKLTTPGHKKLWVCRLCPLTQVPLCLFPQLCRVLGAWAKFQLGIRYHTY